MTRDELDLMVARIDPTNFNATSTMVLAMVKYIDNLEQRIAELEAPKSCPKRDTPLQTV